MDKSDYLEMIEGDSEALLSAAASLPHDNPIAVCDGWTVGDLVAHIGSVWGIAAANVAAGTGEKTGPADPKPPEDPDRLIEWGASVRATVIEALAKADPADSAWSFADNHTAGFWQRRIAQETMLHRWDMQSAALSIDPFYPERAADGIDEYTKVGLLYSSSKPNRTYPSESLHLHTTDTEGEWMLASDDGTTVKVTKEHGKGDAAVRGQAEEVFLWVWGRPAKVEIFGDESVAAAWQELSP